MDRIKSRLPQTPTRPELAARVKSPVAELAGCTDRLGYLAPHELSIYLNITLKHLSMPPRWWILLVASGSELVGDHINVLVVTHYVSLLLPLHPTMPLSSGWCRWRGSSRRTTRRTSQMTSITTESQIAPNTDQSWQREHAKSRVQLLNCCRQVVQGIEH